MALFTDGVFNDVDSLRAYESSIVTLAQQECIDLNTKLEVAYAELGDWILAYLLDRSSDDPQSNVRRVVGLSTLVVNRPLRRWHTLQTLELVYRDAHHGQLNERYKENWRHYRKAAEEARQVWLRTGPGFVGIPVPRGGVPKVEAIAGGWKAGIYKVRTQWVNSGGDSGAIGETIAVDVPANGGLRVSIGTFLSGVAGWNVFVGEADHPPC